jgi:outer membrane protein with beta-barrel domain
MRGKKYLVSLLLAAVVAAPAVPAHAMTWGADVFGAFNTHSMGDVNDAIDAANASGSDFDKVSSSFGGGIGLRVKPNATWMFEGTWEPLFPSTEDNNISGDKINLNANSFQLTGTYWMPSQATNKFGIAAGLGYYTLNGKIESVGFPNVDVSGTGVGFHILGTGEWEVSPGFGFFGSAGYRMAKIDDTQFDDQSTSPKSETDFSGFTARAGLAFYMVPSGASH